MGTISRPSPVRGETYHLLRNLGAAMAIFGLIPLLLTALVIPSGSKFVSGIWILLVGCLFLIGVGCFIIGSIGSHRNHS